MRDPVVRHHPLEAYCSVIDCPEPHERTPSLPLCGAVLELGEGVNCLFVCSRQAGHSLVHIDMRHALEVGVPAWSMVWNDGPEVVAGGEVVPPPAKAGGR